MGAHEARPELLGWMAVGRTSFASGKYSKFVSPSCVGLGHKSSLSLGFLKLVVWSRKKVGDRLLTDFWPATYLSQACSHTVEVTTRVAVASWVPMLRSSAK